MERNFHIHQDKKCLRGRNLSQARNEKIEDSRDVNKHTNNVSDLIKAATFGNMSAMRRLLLPDEENSCGDNKGNNICDRVDVNATTPNFNGSTLIGAAGNGHLEMVHFLLQQGADIDELAARVGHRFFGPTVSSAM